MELKYLRLRLFESVLRPFQKRQRSRRMGLFTRVMGLDRKRRVLDLGGLPGIWNSVEVKQDITFLNLPGVPNFEDPTHHEAHHVQGDACHVEGFEDGSFELVFSNSVIEHVGDREHREAFAREVRRLGHAFWVQTPAKAFPLEAHSGMPLWWFYPKWLRERMLASWEKKLPEWTEMVRGTTVISRKELRALFPEAEIHTERFLGIPKSYVAYAPATVKERAPRGPMARPSEGAMASGDAGVAQFR